MIQEGQVVLFRFPQTDQTLSKLRPALVIRKLPGQYDDWLICMISSQLSQQISEFDEVINEIAQIRKNDYADISRSFNRCNLIFCLCNQRLLSFSTIS